MSDFEETAQSRARSTWRGAAMAVAGLLAIGITIEPALADRAHHDGHGGHDFRGDRFHGGWGGGWHRPPPVVYGSPYYAPYGAPYYPPPVVYAPGVGIGLPGLSVNIPG